MNTELKTQFCEMLKIVKQKEEQLSKETQDAGTHGDLINCLKNDVKRYQLINDLQQITNTFTDFINQMKLRL